MSTSVSVRKLLLGMALGMALCASAQQSTSPVAQHSEQDYVLGPGDQIVLHVVDMDEMPDKPIRIDPSGFIDLPLAGRVEASGLTVE